MVALAAALYATLVGAASTRGVPAAAVLQQARVPLQAQAVRAHTGLPQVFSGVTGLEAGRLRRYGQDLEYGAIHACDTDRRSYHQRLKRYIHKKLAIIQLCESVPLTEMKRANKVAKSRETVPWFGSFVMQRRRNCDSLCRYQCTACLMQKRALWAMTINIVPCITVLSADNGAVVWILLSRDNLDFIAIKMQDSTRRPWLDKTILLCFKFREAGMRADSLEEWTKCTYSGFLK